MRRKFGFVWNHFGGPIVWLAWFEERVEKGTCGVGVGGWPFYVVLPQE